MHALAAIMASRDGKPIPIKPVELLTEAQKLDVEARIQEHSCRHDPFYSPKRVDDCTMAVPCQNVNCRSCVGIHNELVEITRGFGEFLTTPEGRLEQWCAEQSRKAGLPEQRRKTDSTEPPSFG